MPILTVGIGVNVPRGEEDEKKRKYFVIVMLLGMLKKTRDQFQPTISFIDIADQPQVWARFLF